MGKCHRSEPFTASQSWLLNIFQFTAEFTTDLDPYSRAWHTAVLSKGLLERKNTGIALGSGVTCFQHLPPVLAPALPTPPSSLGAQIRPLLGPTFVGTGVEGSHLSQDRAEGRQRVSRCGRPWQGTQRPGLEEVLLLPPPWQRATFLHPGQSRRSCGKVV